MLSVLRDFGWLIIFEKSNLTPTQCLIYLGACIDTHRNTVSLPEQKIPVIHSISLRKPVPTDSGDDGGCTIHSQMGSMEGLSILVRFSVLVEVREHEQIDLNHIRDKERSELMATHQEPFVLSLPFADHLHSSHNQCQCSRLGSCLPGESG